MATTLVTGGTGELGTQTVEALRRAGHDVRVLSRKGGPAVLTGDLLTGEGVSEALHGVDTVVHCATAYRKSDIDAAAVLFEAARQAGNPHVVLISIVGIDSIPLPFYRQRLEIEHRLEGSGLPCTILRATQFHSLVEKLFSAQRRSPVLFVPRLTFQPVDVADVAERLAVLASGGPAGRADDLGGPERLPAERLALHWQEAAGVRRHPWLFTLPGRSFDALGRGENLVPGNTPAQRTFRSYLEAKYAPERR